MTEKFSLKKNLIKELSLLTAAALSIIFGQINIYILILSIIVHELGHIFAAYAVGAKTENIAIHGFGVEITFPGKTLSSQKLLSISVAGPIASLLLSFIGFKVNNFILFISNISIAFINLLPVYPLDGGNILYAILSPRFSRKTVSKTLSISGKLIGSIISLFGIAILIVSGINISLIYMGLFIFFSSGKHYNPVYEVASSDYPNFERVSLFSIDSSINEIDAIKNLPTNSIAAIRNKDGEILNLVTPLYLYNKSIKKRRP